MEQAEFSSEINQEHCFVIHFYGLLIGNAGF